MEYDETVYACVLNGIFCKRCTQAAALLKDFCSPGEIFCLSERELRELCGRKQDIAEAIMDRSRLKEARLEVEWARNLGIDILYFRDRSYPLRLKECPDAPILLYRKGISDLSPERAVAIVGTRKATRYGMEECKAIVKHMATLTPPPVIISGLAYGIDICAHRTALECKLETFGIMATGMDIIYPSAHRADAARMIRQGCVLSDFQKGTQPMPFNFIRRNRIIAGMSDAVIVVESGNKGGSMITANMGLSYSREIFAVPGRTTDRYSEGCNSLIRRNAAGIASSPEDICSALGWKSPNISDKKSRFEEIFNNCDSIKRNILLALSVDSPLDRDTLTQKAGNDTAKVLTGLTELELEEVIESDLYGYYYLKI